VPASAKTYEGTTRDLQAERASGLARASERLEAALEAFAAADAAFARRPTEAHRAARLEALAYAGERLWFLVIQREAIGLGRHEVVHETLKVPPAVRAAMGPQPRPR
jgi:hypothetical protein